MSIELIFILIIVFNVVTSLIARQAKKKKAMEEAQRAGRPVEALDEDDTDFDLLMEEEEEGSAYQDMDSHEDRRRREKFTPSPTRSEERSARPAESSPNRAAKVGRDVMKEIAKELGIVIPGSEDDEGTTSGQPSRPVAKPDSSTRKKVEAKPDSLKARDVSREATVLERKLEQGDEYGIKPYHEKASWQKKEYKEYGNNRAHAEQLRKRQAVEVIDENERARNRRMERILSRARTPQGLAEAFILKTVIDSPVSKRAREGMRPRLTPSKGPTPKNSTGESSKG